jgi:hypothetical protein
MLVNYYREYLRPLIVAFHKNSCTEPVILKLEGNDEVFPVKIDKNEDLPAPDGPIMVTNYPDLISPLKFYRIGFF